MKMMTAKLTKAFIRQGDTDGKPADKVMVLAHYFAGSWDWWATEYDPKEKVFFGLVRGFETEFGNFSLSELEENSCERKPLGGIERDLYWTPKPLSEIMEKAGMEEKRA